MALPAVTAVYPRRGTSSGSFKSKMRIAALGLAATTNPATAAMAPAGPMWGYDHGVGAVRVDCAVRGGDVGAPSWVPVVRMFTARLPGVEPSSLEGVKP